MHRWSSSSCAACGSARASYTPGVSGETHGSFDTGAGEGVGDGDGEAAWGVWAGGGDCAKPGFLRGVWVWGGAEGSWGRGCSGVLVLICAPLDLCVQGAVRAGVRVCLRAGVCSFKGWGGVGQRHARRCAGTPARLEQNTRNAI